MNLLCHPSFTATNLSYRFPIVETSATALCGSSWYIHSLYPWNIHVKSCKAPQYVRVFQFYLPTSQHELFGKQHQSQSINPANSEPLKTRRGNRTDGNFHPLAGIAELQASHLGIYMIGYQWPIFDNPQTISCG